MDTILQLIHKEKTRQQQTIRLIASENYVSESILTALGSFLTNKYSEGYALNRYYEGQEYIDAIELQAIQDAKTLFGAEYVNVQAYSGSPANLAVYLATLKPGDTLLGLDLSSGGHLTHGSKVSISGKWFNAISYGLHPDTMRIDYEQLEQRAHEHSPKVIISGLSAYPREIDFERIGAIAHSVGALHLADISHISGLVATGEHPHPFPHADIMTTTTHKILRGPRGALIMTNTPTLAKKIDKAVFPGIQGGPHMNNVAGIAIALQEALTPEYTDYTKQVKANTQALAEALMQKGYDLVTGGSDNHLVLVDLRSKNINGDIFSKQLMRAHIETNKNAIPFDTLGTPQKPNGIRLGTPAVTTLGMQELEMRQIAHYIDQVYQAGDSMETLNQIKTEVIEFMNQFKL